MLQSSPEDSDLVRQHHNILQPENNSGEKTTLTKEAHSGQHLTSRGGSDGRNPMCSGSETCQDAGVSGCVGTLLRHQWCFSCHQCARPTHTGPLTCSCSWRAFNAMRSGNDDGGNSRRYPASRSLKRSGRTSADTILSEIQRSPFPSRRGIQRRCFNQMEKTISKKTVSGRNWIVRCPKASGALHI
ncbi:hypothetical protein BD310DRAFT_914570 [Dichomitus squalens]|uniref:Uncharacterized protein n=1 Tax=Dichomitus squalens TaxID=114155 RepID=A0A4Q9Q9Z8_9APHY|nr:hypothetical protein BD310DRAFT_914570 [Dichomitus squalens]